MAHQGSCLIFICTCDRSDPFIEGQNVNDRLLQFVDERMWDLNSQVFPSKDVQDLVNEGFPSISL